MHHIAIFFVPVLISFILLLTQPLPIVCVKFPDVPSDRAHFAHAKTGGPYFLVDWNGDGIEEVTLDASLSHTHFFDPGPPRLVGKLVKFEWFLVKSGRRLLLSSHPFLSANFHVGVTLLKLVVTDNARHSAQAFTSVTVRAPLPHEKRSPTVRKIRPKGGPITGGVEITILGTGFYNRPTIIFGGRQYRGSVVSEREMKFRVPKMSHPITHRVYVSNRYGTSATYAKFHYRDTRENPVQFRSGYVKRKNGSLMKVAEPTCIVTGPDGHFYVGSRDGFIHRLAIDERLVLRRACRSDNVGMARSVLGLAFDPGETVRTGHDVRVYVSTSTLVWPERDTGDGWDNGRVEVWGVKYPRQKTCLKLERTIVSGLPVSSGDHGVNALAFRKDGMLLISVGGTTNAGVHRGGNLGNGGDGTQLVIAESALSGAILAMPVYKEWFNGSIEYSHRHDPGKARVISGSVHVMASGFRNALGMTVHSNGGVYALDNGPNKEYGRAATGCGKTGGQVSGEDKLVRVKWDGYYGHANWNRGRWDRRQCKYVDGSSKDEGHSFSGAMAMVASSTNGIVEYTADRFDGGMTGWLVLSQLAWLGRGTVTAVGLSRSGHSIKGPTRVLHNDSGIAVAMGKYGELMLAKHATGQFLALKPVEKHGRRLRVVSVTPRRGGRQGGNVVNVVGDGLWNDTEIVFGRRVCHRMTWIRRGRELRCVVPPMKEGAGRKVAVVARRRSDGAESARSLSRVEYEYVRDAPTTTR